MPSWVRAPNTGHDPAAGDGTEVVEAVLVVLGVVGVGVVLREVVRGGVLGGRDDVVGVVDLVVDVVLGVVEGVGRGRGDGLLGDGLGDALGDGLCVGSTALLGAGSGTKGADVGSSANETGPGEKSERAGGSASDGLVDTTAGAAWTCCLRWTSTPTRTPRVSATATADAIPSAHRCCIGRPPLLPAVGRRDVLAHPRA